MRRFFRFMRSRFCPTAVLVGEYLAIKLAGTQSKIGSALPMPPRQLVELLPTLRAEGLGPPAALRVRAQGCPGMPGMTCPGPGAPTIAPPSVDGLGPIA
jgi:hypothetical protein